MRGRRADLHDGVPGKRQLFSFSEVTCERDHRAGGLGIVRSTLRVSSVQFRTAGFFSRVQRDDRSGCVSAQTLVVIKAQQKKIELKAFQ